VNILVTQVLNFDKYQLAAISSLVVTVVIWFMVRSALRVERERAVVSAGPPVGSGTGDATRVS
jgi:hypothetical protein